MFEEPKEKNFSQHQDLDLERTVNAEKQKVSVIVNGVNSVNGLYLCAAFAQIFLGIAVVALSLIELIQPAWLATLMLVIGSFTSVIGLYFMYTIFSDHGAFDSLLNKAIKRVITYQN